MTAPSYSGGLDAMQCNKSAVGLPIVKRMDDVQDEVEYSQVVVSCFRQTVALMPCLTILLIPRPR